MNKKHKLKKEAEDKLREYLNQYEEDIKRINTNGIMSKEDLIPFKKGSEILFGRPKGSKNRSTIIREMLDMMVQVKDDQGNDVWQSNEYRMVQTMITKAIEKQDVAAILLWIMFMAS